MTEKTRRLDRISRSLDWGVKPDPEREFWRCGEAWSALGSLANYPYSWRVYAVRLLEAGHIEQLKALFIRAGSSLNESPSSRQLDWAVEALRKVAPDWRQAEWWADGELELENPSEWLAGLFEQALSLLEAGRFYIEPVMRFTRGSQDYYYEPWILARDMEAQECAGQLRRLFNRWHLSAPKNLKEFNSRLQKQQKELENGNSKSN